MSLVGGLPKASSLCLSSDHFFLLHNRLRLLEISSSSVSFFHSEHSHLTSAYPLQRLGNEEEQEPMEVCVSMLDFINESK